MADWRIIIGDFGVRNVGNGKNDEDRARREYSYYANNAKIETTCGYYGQQIKLECDGVEVKISPLDVAIDCMPMAKQAALLKRIAGILWPTGLENAEEWDAYEVGTAEAIGEVLDRAGISPDKVR